MSERPLPDWQPKILWWLVTGRCSLACEHCYLRGTPQRGRELTREQALDVVQRAAALGIQEVVLTGGEPLLRRDLPELLAAFHTHGLRLVGLETHGSPLDAPALAALAAHDPVVYVSLDGDAEHDALRGAPGLAREARAAIETFLQAGRRVVVSSTLMPGRGRVLPDLLPTLEDLGVHGWRMYRMAPIGGAAVLPEVSAAEEAATWGAVLDRWLAAERPFDLWIDTLLIQRRRLDGSLIPPRRVCDYFADAVTLLPDGRLAPCCRYGVFPELMAPLEGLDLRALGPDLARSVLADLKQRAFAERLTLPENEACRTCLLRDRCQLGCEVAAWVESGATGAHERRTCELMQRHYDRFEPYDHVKNGRRSIHDRS